MKQLLGIALTLIFVSANFSCRNSTNEISFDASWSVGDSYDFKITKVSTIWKNDYLAEDNRFEYTTTFTVIDSTENSYTIKWVHFNDLESIYNIPEALLDSFSEYKKIDIIYKTSATGAFVEVMNLGKIIHQTNNLFDDMIEIIGKDDEQKKRDIRVLREALCSKQGIEMLLLEDIKFIHYPMGVKYNSKEKFSYKIDLPNPLGGKSIKANVNVTFNEVDTENSFCVFNQTTSIDKDGSRESVKTMFEKTKPNDKEVEKTIEESTFEINENNTFEFYYIPGVPHRIEAVRERLINIIDSSQIRRVERTVIERIYNK